MQNKTGDKLRRYEKLSEDYFFSWKKTSQNSLLHEN